MEADEEKKKVKFLELMKKKGEYRKIQFEELRKKKIEEEIKKNYLEEEENRRRLQIQKIYEDLEKNRILVLQKNCERKKKKKKKKRKNLSTLHIDREKHHKRDKRNTKSESKLHAKSEEGEHISLRDLCKIDDYERSREFTPKKTKTIELPETLKYNNPNPLLNWFKNSMSSPVTKRKLKIQMNMTGNFYKRRSLDMIDIDIQTLNAKIGTSRTNRNSLSSSATSLVKPYILLPSINPNNATMPFVILLYV